MVRVFAELSRKDFEAFTATLCSLWNEKNSVRHGSQCRQPNDHRETVGWLFHEFQQARLKIDRAPQPENRHVHVKWNCPPASKLKLNVDAAINSSSKCMGVGGVIKNYNGDVIDVFSRRFSLSPTPYVAELLATKEVLS